MDETIENKIRNSKEFGILRAYPRWPELVVESRTGIYKIDLRVYDEGVRLCQLINKEVKLIGSIKYFEADNKIVCRPYDKLIEIAGITNIHPLLRNYFNLGARGVKRRRPTIVCVNEKGETIIPDLTL
jgi:hypothetical protein